MTLTLNKDGDITGVTCCGDFSTESVSFDSLEEYREHIKQTKKMNNNQL